MCMLVEIIIQKVNKKSLMLLIFTAITSLIAAIASMVGAFQKKRIDSLTLDLEKAKKNELSSKTELYNVYLNLNELLEIEKELSDELEIGKTTTRKNKLTNRYAQPKHVKTRIFELEKEIQKM